MQPAEDTDWLAPDSYAPPPPRQTDAHDDRVYRDDGDAMVTEYRSLTVAIAESPATPEAVVLDADRRCLAMAHPDKACDGCDDEGRCARGPWVLTGTGLERLTAERRSAA